MCDSRAPTQGADSEQRRPFRVTMEDDLIRFDVRITAAYGPRDATNQARDRYPAATVLAVREVERVEASL